MEFRDIITIALLTAQLKIGLSCYVVTSGEISYTFYSDSHCYGLHIKYNVFDNVKYSTVVFYHLHFICLCNFSPVTIQI